MFTGLLKKKLSMFEYVCRYIYTDTHKYVHIHVLCMYMCFKVYAIEKQQGLTV